MESCNHIPKTPCVCINLRRIAQKVTDIYDHALKPVGITINQFSLLATIRQIKGCGTGELARQVGLEKSTLVRTLHPLLNNGLVIDKSPPSSRRRQLYLSAEGNAVFKRAFPLWRKTQDEINARLGRQHDELMEIFSTI